MPGQELKVVSEAIDDGYRHFVKHSSCRRFRIVQTGCRVSTRTVWIYRARDVRDSYLSIMPMADRGDELSIPISPRAHSSRTITSADTSTTYICRKSAVERSQLKPDVLGLAS